MDNTSKKVVVAIVALVILVAVLVGGYMLRQRSDRVVQRASVIGGLHGSLTMTMTAGGLVGPYTFDFDTGKLVHSKRVSGMLLHHERTAPHGMDVAYRCRSTTDVVPQVCVYRSATDTHTTVTHNDYPAKKYFRWSPDTKSLLYVASLSPTISATSSDSSQWSIFLAHADGSSEKRIAAGTAAFFSPDGNSIYSLERNGLHEHDLASSTDRVVWVFAGEETNRFTTLVVSKDGRKLAWADPLAEGGKGKLVFFSVPSWNPFTLQRTGELSLRVMQMQFSPDGRALALIADSPEGNQGLYAYTLGENVPIKILGLEAYDRQTFISEWK